MKKKMFGLVFITFSFFLYIVLYEVIHTYLYYTYIVLLEFVIEELMEKDFMCLVLELKANYTYSKYICNYVYEK